MPSLSCHITKARTRSVSQSAVGAWTQAKCKVKAPSSTAHLDLLLDVLNGVRGLDIEGDGLASQRLDEDLHAAATSQAQHQVQRALLLDVVVRQGAAILQLLASEDEALLIRGNALLVLSSTHSVSIAASNRAQRLRKNAKSKTTKQ